MSKRHIRAIPKNPPHVTLTKETINKLLREDSLPDRQNVHLDPLDRLALERSAHAADRAAMESGMAKLNHRIAELEAQVKNLQWLEMVEKAHQELAAATAAEGELLQSIAKRYGFEWRDHSYNRETGEVTRD
jgi:hypothetical protein